MFWNPRPNEKEMLEIIENFNTGKFSIIEIKDEVDYDNIWNKVILLKNTKWTTKFKTLHADKLKTIIGLEKILEDDDVARQKQFCVNCKHIAGDNNDCNHEHNTRMDYVTGTITDHIYRIGEQRNDQCKGYYFEAK
jgi:hypothetical protein